MKNKTMDLKRKNGSIKKRKTIKKPKFLPIFLKCTALCVVISLAAGGIYLKKRLDEINSDAENIYDSQTFQVSDALFHYLAYKNRGNTDLADKYMNLAVRDLYILSAFGSQSGRGGHAEVWVNGEKTYEAPRGYFSIIGITDPERIQNEESNTEYYFLEDESWLSPVTEKYDLSFPEEILASSDTLYRIFHEEEDGLADYTYEFGSVFINRETHKFIPEIVTVYKSSSSLINDEVDVINCTLGRTIPDGFERIPGIEFSRIMSGSVSREGADTVLPNVERAASKDDPPAYEFRYSDFRPYKLLEIFPYTTPVVLVGSAILGLLIGLVISEILYHRRKTVWEIFDYRKKTTEAMAHDLKTPLATISAYAESMEGATEEEQNSYAEKIRENVSEMNRMVESILQFSKSEGSMIAAEPVYVDMEKMVRGAISKSEKLFEVNKIRTNVTVDTPCEMITDEAMLRQAVENIVGNSAKYASENSEVEIRISSEKITFRNQTDEKIEDAESLKKPFVKGESARGENGTGLGLSIADNNLRALGYDLKLSFNDGCFTAEILISL